jgi:hypothetical protein
LTSVAAAFLSGELPADDLTPAPSPRSRPVPGRGRQ